ncbi:MAG: TatD family hydrolase [Deltaproteobacteria bacterium]|nr:TatD family hydrolase [Deltaproteobacteria bacterium]
MFVDSHCHLELEDFDIDRDEIVFQAKNEGLKYILTVGTEKRYFDKVLEIIYKYDFIFGAIGVHPHSSVHWKELSLNEMEELVSHKKIVAYGEIGLDFYKNYSPPSVQKEAFFSQLEFAKAQGKPVIVHTRSSASETIDIIDAAFKGGKGGVIHCFSYGKEEAKRFLDRGFYISIPGIVTYRKNGSLVDVVRYVPLNRLLVETDAPFLTPSPKKGKRNLPYYVKYTLEKVAQIKRISVLDMSQVVLNNFRNLFLKEIET